MTTNALAAAGQDAVPKFAITLKADQPALSAVATSRMTATVTMDGVAASGQNVVFTWKVKDDPQPAQPGAVLATRANGTATYKLNNVGGRARTLTVTAALESFPSITATADVRFELPEGFIALADLPLSLGLAESFCREQGGKLPRINDGDPLPRSDINQITRIDGFGAPGAPWPSGLIYDRYWTGTKFADEQHYVPGVHSGVWLIGVSNDKVRVHNEGKSVTYRVVCVP